jgi:hypothetical protein
MRYGAPPPPCLRTHRIPLPLRSFPAPGKLEADV